MHNYAYYESWGVGLASIPNHRLTISEPITTISYNSWDNNNNKNSYLENVKFQKFSKSRI